ncbi:unnamed protein product, partial [marine sediment metagenome]
GQELVSTSWITPIKKSDITNVISLPLVSGLSGSWGSDYAT